MPVWAFRSVKSLRFSDEDAAAIWEHCHQQHHTNNTHNLRAIEISINNYHFQLKESLSVLNCYTALYKLYAAAFVQRWLLTLMGVY